MSATGNIDDRYHVLNNDAKRVAYRALKKLFSALSPESACSSVSTALLHFINDNYYSAAYHIRGAGFSVKDPLFCDLARLTLTDTGLRELNFEAGVTLSMDVYNTPASEEFVPCASCGGVDAEYVGTNEQYSEKHGARVHAITYKCPDCSALTSLQYVLASVEVEVDKNT